MDYYLIRTPFDEELYYTLYKSKSQLFPYHTIFFNYNLKFSIVQLPIFNIWLELQLSIDYNTPPAFGKTPVYLFILKPTFHDNGQ